MLTRVTSRALTRRRRAGWMPGAAVDPSGSPAWPLAVGAVIAPHVYTGRTRTDDRLALALGAYRLGYFLLDLIDIPAWRSLNWADAWSPVWQLVERAGADAVVVYPRIPRHVPDPPERLTQVTIRELRIDD